MLLVVVIEQMYGHTHCYRRFSCLELMTNALENPVESRLETRFHLLAVDAAENVH